MATKAQEREALEKIRKIVEGLGENSYISMAFEGCFDDAEENIENDFGLSMNGRWQDAEQTVERLSAELIIAKAEIEGLKNQKEQLGKRIEQHAESFENLRAKKEEYKQSALENWNKFREQEDRADALEQEIIKLKAKLYDMMTA